MELHVEPPVSDAVQRALARALADAGVLRGGASGGYAGRWWKAAVREATTASSPAAYARSPRSTRGATRA